VATVVPRPWYAGHTSSLAILRVGSSIPDGRRAKFARSVANALIQGGGCGSRFTLGGRSGLSAAGGRAVAFVALPLLLVVGEDAEHMNAVRGVIGLIAVTSLFVGRAVGAAHPAPPPVPATLSHELRMPPGIDLTDLLGVEGTPAGAADDALDMPRVDVYGNEIQEAVGDYRVDPTGGMYESHSPDTEVPHLGPKTS
jgi:hypothetical protein